MVDKICEETCRWRSSRRIQNVNGFNVEFAIRMSLQSQEHTGLADAIVGKSSREEAFLVLAADSALVGPTLVELAELCSLVFAGPFAGQDHEQ